MRGDPGLDAAWAAVAARIGLVGAERVLLKRLGGRGGALAATFVFFGVGALGMTPFALGAGPVQPGYLLFALPSAAVYTVAFLCYVSALREGEVSVIGPLGTTNAIFVVLLAAALYGEGLTLSKAAGTVLIVAGAAALQAGPRIGGGLRRRFADRPARRMLAYALLLALTRMLDKAGAGQAPALVYAWTVFMAIAGLLAFELARRGRLREVAECVAGAPLVALGAGLCNGGSFLLLILALARLPVSLAEPLTALSLLVTAALARLWLGEPIRARWLPTLAVVAGSWLLLGGGGM
jgi:transporter family protein